MDGRSVPSGTVLQADVCVIGGGAAGITIARTLAGTSRTVIVLEGGDTVRDSAEQAFADGDASGEPIRSYDKVIGVIDTRVRNLGGSTRAWGGFARPLMGLELEDRSCQPVGGWPLWAAELATWYPQAHDLIGLGPFDYDAASWLARLGASLDLPLGPELALTIAQKRYRNFGTYYQADLAAASNVTVYLHSAVTNLNAAPAGAHVSSAQVGTLAGSGFTVEAPAFVLAGGGIENPRLLLASNDVVPAGLGNAHDRVGRYYADHFLAFGGFLASPHPAASLGVIQLGGNSWPTTDGGSVKILGLLALSEDTLRREDLPGVHLETIVADPTLGPNQATGITDDVIGELFAATGAGFGSIVAFNTFVEPILDPDSRIMLSTRTDPLGRPLADVHWRYGPADQANLLRALELLGRSLAQVGAGRIQHAGGWLTYGTPTGGTGLDAYLTRITVTPDGDVPELVPMSTTFHHMCTTRMDPDPSKGVVDIDCRVHGIDNLWIAGSSVFPTAPGYYPTITLLALALRLADHLHTEVLP